MKMDQGYKILVLGESKVGKSSILNRFIENEFSENLTPTLGIDYKIKKIQIKNQEIKLQIWDTAGQERFRSITESFYKGCNGVLLVFDITDRDSFDKIKTWIDSIFNKIGNVVICLIANKTDLQDKSYIHFIKTVEIEEISKQFNMPVFYTSAKNNVNIKEVFYFIAENILENFARIKPIEGISFQKKKKTKKKCC